MDLERLRGALRGIAAYKHLMDEPVMELTLALLDAIHNGQGEEAVERYTRLFLYPVRGGQRRSGPLAGYCPAGSGVPLCTDGGA